MSDKNKIKTIVYNTIKNICIVEKKNEQEIEDKTRIIDDLNFTSLDIAQLVATMEVETSIDPFANGASLSDIQTVGDFYNLYSKLN